MLAYTAVRVDVNGAEWVKNAAGFNHSDQHGFGLLDAFRMTRTAGVSVVWLDSYLHATCIAYKVSTDTYSNTSSVEVAS